MLYNTLLTYVFIFVEQANRGANKFKYVSLSDYDINKNVFKKSNATSRLGYSLGNPPCDIDEEGDIKERFLHPSNRRSDDDEESFQDYIRGQHLGSKPARPSCGRGRGRKKRTTDAKCVSAAMMEVASSLKSWVDVSMVS